MDTLYEIGFKSGARITLGLKEPQQFIDAVVGALQKAPQAQVTWYGEPSCLFQLTEVAYVLPKASLQTARRIEHSELREARARMESARKAMASAASQSYWVAFEVANDAFTAAASEFDAAFDKAITA